MNLGLRERILNTKVERRACAGQTFPQYGTIMTLRGTLGRGFKVQYGFFFLQNEVALFHGCTRIFTNLLNFLDCAMEYVQCACALHKFSSRRNYGWFLV